MPPLIRFNATGVLVSAGAPVHVATSHSDVFNTVGVLSNRPGVIEIVCYKHTFRRKNRFFYLYCAYIYIHNIDVKTISRLRTFVFGAVSPRARWGLSASSRAATAPYKSLACQSSNPVSVSLFFVRSFDRRLWSVFNSDSFDD